MRVNETLGLHERKCVQCGKDFEARQEWQYKRPKTVHDHTSYRYFCSYRCLRAYEKEHEHVNVKKQRMIQYQLNIGEYGGR